MVNFLIKDSEGWTPYQLAAYLKAEPHLKILEEFVDKEDVEFETEDSDKDVKFIWVNH